MKTVVVTRWDGTTYTRTTREYPWEGMRINERFMNDLRTTFHDRPFTNREAYQLYADGHSNYRNKPEHLSLMHRPLWQDQWLQMTVRNNLCAAAYRGQLVRVAKGTYHF